MVEEAWTVFKAALVTGLGRDGAADFLEHAAATMRTEANIERAQAHARDRQRPDYQALTPHDLQQRIAQGLRTAANSETTET